MRKKKIAINNISFFEDLIWMSYRYCIGRKTIAAHSHAGEIAKNAYHVLSEERKSFMATDIRREINDVLHYNDNVTCYDYRNTLPQDGLSTIVYHMLETRGNKVNIDDFTYRVENNDVTVEEKNYEMQGAINSLYRDLNVWIKLANALDSSCHKTVVTEYEGKIEEFECFSYPYIDLGGRYIDKKWVSVDRYLANPTVDSYIAPEYIKEIK